MSFKNKRLSVNHIISSLAYYEGINLWQIEFGAPSGGDAAGPRNRAETRGG